MEKMKYYTIFLDGIDKTGKDTIRQYVWQLNKALNVFCRGYVSLEAYNRKFDRNVVYEKPYKNALYVLLCVNKEDWAIRCKITNEPAIDYDKDSKLFEEVFASLGNDYKKLEFNTSCFTPYQIAKAIVETVAELNK